MDMDLAHSSLSDFRSIDFLFPSTSYKVLRRCSRMILSKGMQEDRIEKDRMPRYSQKRSIATGIDKWEERAMRTKSVKCVHPHQVTLQAQVVHVVAVHRLTCAEAKPRQKSRTFVEQWSWKLYNQKGVTKQDCCWKNELEKNELHPIQSSFQMRSRLECKSEERNEFFFLSLISLAFWFLSLSPFLVRLLLVESCYCCWLDAVVDKHFKTECPNTTGEYSIAMLLSTLNKISWMQTFENNIFRTQ